MTLRSLARPLGALALLLTLLPDASAQVLDNVWFRVKGAAKVAAVRPDDTIEKGKGKVIFYVNIRIDDEGGGDGFEPTTYEYSVFSEVGADNWQMTSMGTLRTEGDREQLMIGTVLGPSAEGIRWQIVIPDEDTTVLQLVFLAQLKAKFDKFGALKTASFKSVNGLVVSGDGDGDNLVGSAKLKAKLIDPEKLPFEP